MEHSDANRADRKSQKLENAWSRLRRSLPKFELGWMQQLHRDILLPPRDLGEPTGTSSIDRLKRADNEVVSDIQVAAQQGFIPESLMQALHHIRMQMKSEHRAALATEREQCAGELHGLREQLFAQLEEPLPTKPVIVFRNVSRG